MKVYTHFEHIDSWSEKKGKKIQDGIRWRTLLQYGDSWDIIGSVVMINPGSANFKSNCPIEGTTLEMLKQFEDKDSKYNWYEFNEDNAMVNVGKLFAIKNGLDDRNKLNGVIQIFNLFYIKDQNLDEAIKKYENIVQPSLFSSEDDIKYLRYHCGKELKVPVYLGFGSAAFNTNFITKAKLVFDSVIGQCPHLNKDFYFNKYYYPTYLIGRGKNRLQSKIDLGKFILEKNELTEEDMPLLLGKYGIDFSNNTVKGNISTFSINMKTIEETVLSNFEVNRYNNKKRLRKQDNSVYGITIANGLILVRQAYEGKMKVAQPLPSDSAVVKMLNERGYTEDNIWRGKRKISTFGKDEKEIVTNVINEVNILFDLLENI